MNYYWINIKGSENEVIDHHFFWAPLYSVNKNNVKRNVAGWNSLDHVRTGDIFFCKNGANFEYAAIATSDVHITPRPESRKSNKPNRDGRRVNISLIKLDAAINAGDIIDGLLATGPDACTPKVVSQKGGFCQVYASRLSHSAGEYLSLKVNLRISDCVDTPVSIQKPSLSPFKSLPPFYSWTVLSEDVIYKNVDPSLVNDFSTGIPLDCVSFFCPAELAVGDKLDITLLVGGDKSSACIRRNATGRYILSLSKAANLLKLAQLTAGDKLWFERISGQVNTFCAYTMSEDNTISVLPPQNTSSIATVNIRIGQSYFKAATSIICGHRCVVTGVADQKPSILIGSHIKPWSESDDTERMDGHNGLLLAPHVDKLFDKHLITFSDDKRIIVSAQLEGDVLETWGIDTQKVYTLTEKQLEYMQHHRACFNALQEKQLKS